MFTFSFPVTLTCDL